MRQGEQLPYFIEGENRPSVFSAGDMNKLVRVLNALLKLPGLKLSDLSASLGTEGSVGDSSSSNASADSLFPFKIFNPGSDVTVFRIHGGLIGLPIYYPADTAQREFTSTVHVTAKVTCTDQVYSDDPTATQYSGNDLTLNTWTAGGGSQNTACAIWLVITQAFDDPGNLTMTLEAEYFGNAADLAQVINAFQDGPTTGGQYTRILLGIIKPVLAGSSGAWTLESSTVSQFVRSNIVVFSDTTRGRMVNPWEDVRIYFPGEIVKGSDNKFYLHFGAYPSINYDPTAPGYPWKALT